MEFIELSDAFASYSGQAGKTIRIKETEDGLEPGEIAPAAEWNPDLLPLIPSDQDDQFDDTSLDPKWTEWDLGTPKLTVSEAYTFAIFTHATENAGRWRGLYQALPAGDFTIAIKSSLIGSTLGDSASALCLFEDAEAAGDDVVLLMHFLRNSGNKYRDIFIQKWADYETFNTNYAGGNIYPNTTCYLRIRRSGTTLYYDYSSDGISWQRVYAHTQPFVPAHMGFVSQNNNSGITTYGYFDLFRYIASNQVGPLGRMG